MDGGVGSQDCLMLCCRRTGRPSDVEHCGSARCDEEHCNERRERHPCLAQHG